MRKLLWNLTWLIVRPLMVLFCHFQVKGIENIANLKRPFIIAAAMHSNYADSFILSSALPFLSEFFPIRFMAAKSWIEMPVIGWLMKIYGSYPVIKGETLDESLKKTESLLEKGEIVGIFPEGKMSKTGEFNEFKSGAAYLSIKTGFPIVPMAISGIFGLNLLSFILRKKYITIAFSEPLWPNLIGFSAKKNPGISKEDVDKFTAIIREKIKKLYFSIK